MMFFRETGRPSEQSPLMTIRLDGGFSLSSVRMNHVALPLNSNGHKVKGPFVVLLAILFSIQACAGDSKNWSQVEKAYLTLPEEQLAIAEGSLVIAKGLYPDLNIQEYLGQIDAMAEELRIKLRNVRAPAEIIKIINNYLFVKKGFKFQEDKDFLNDVLDDKHGSCNGLSSLYLSISERLHLPLYAVRMPEHLFIRYDDGNIRMNIETTQGGVSAPDAEYVKMSKIKMSEFSSISIKQGIFLSNLTKRQFLASVLNNRGRARNGDTKKEIDDYSEGISLDPKHVALYANRGYAYGEIGEYQKAIMDLKKAVAMNPNSAMAYISLGGVYGLVRDFDGALESFSKAISLNPEKSLLENAYINRGMIYAIKRDSKNVFGDLRKAINLNPALKNELGSLTAFKVYWNDEEFKRIVE